MCDLAGPRRSVCFVVSHPYFINYYCLHQVNELAQVYEIALFCDLSEVTLSEKLSPLISVRNMNFGRKPSVLKDLTNIVRLVWFFVKGRPDAVHSFSPKVGFMAMLAARLAGVRWRLHFFTGQIWSNKKGLIKLIYRWLDKITALNATHVLVDGHAQSAFLMSERIGTVKKNTVLGCGSVGGVDLNRFFIDYSFREAERVKLRCVNNTTIFLYLGRLNNEKGIRPLVLAARDIYQHASDIHLVLAGPLEGFDIDDFLQEEDASRYLTYLGEISAPERVINASDVLCLISEREGFGTVVIEAAACGVPAIVSDIYGLRDSVVPNETGLVVSLGDGNQLRTAMSRLCESSFRKQLGLAAKERAEKHFSSESMTDLWLKYYERLFQT